MRVKKQLLAKIMASYIYEKEGMTFFQDTWGFSYNTVTPWLNGNSAIRVDNIKLMCEGYLETKGANFISYLETKLDENRFDKEIAHSILTKDESLYSRITDLIKYEFPTKILQQDAMNIGQVMHYLRDHFTPYHEYIQIDNTLDYKKANKKIADRFEYKSLAPKYDELVVEKKDNLLILKVLNGNREPKAGSNKEYKDYRVGILLSNYIAESDFEYGHLISMVKSIYDLHMVLVFTDLGTDKISLERQKMLLHNYNLVYEMIKTVDSADVVVQGCKFDKDDMSDIKRKLDEYRYAQLIFERFMTYLSVIDNDIIFMPYTKEEELIKIGKGLSGERQDINGKYAIYTNDIMPKNICRYSYLARHTIYYERTLVSTLAETMIKKRKGAEKLPLVVEICAPNSLTTSSIVDKCKELMLFTGSHYAYDLMTSLNKDYSLFPSNVSVNLCPMDPQYMTLHFPKVFKGKIDLLVVGYGAGSQISDLKRFVRFAHNWLSPQGAMFISVYNKESIVLNKLLVRDQRFENTPLNISDYWTYLPNEHTSMLKQIKTYTKAGLRNICSFRLDMVEENEYTYPYMSALINPDDYKRIVLDEIREADKQYAVNGDHGILIDGIAYKQSVSVGKKYDIYKRLKEQKVDYSCIEHVAAPDSISLINSYSSESNDDFKEATLLKTIVICKKQEKTSYKYVIMPHDWKINLESGYDLVSEKTVANQYGGSAISPLKIWIDAKDRIIPSDDIVIFDDLSDMNKDVIMLGESNRESVKIRKKTFLGLFEKLGIKAGENKELSVIK